MCGIAGYVSAGAPAGQDIVRQMCAQIRHRGPDDEGVYVDGQCAIGMRRLSIIDVEGGHQPISNEDGSVWVVFNGEIYNHQALRTRLAALGHQLASRSVTEVIVHLYEEHGEDFVRHLDGMFASALWDDREKKLLLTRDRLGEKPLYY